MLKKSRFIDPKKCTGCMACVEKCPVFVPSEYDQGLVKRTAINRRYAQAVPGIVTVDKQGISPCRVDCPAEVNAHAYVTLTAAGRYKEALEVVRRTNPFPASIGRVCTHPCESACRRGDVDAPVQICYLKRFLTDWEDGHGGFVAPAVPAEKLEKVAVVGSGPAGMTCARDLALKGYQVTVFEKLPVAGGMLRVSIPAYRLPKDVVQKEVDQICSLGVEVKVNQALGKDFTIDSLQKDGFKAIFVALGTHKALQLQIPGEKDFPQVLDCIAFLRDVNLDKKPDYAGKKVVVVGGGNAAIDSARTSLRLGADVVIAYRRTIPEMPANSWEIEEAEEEGVKIQTLVAPVRVVGANGKVTGLEVQKMQLGEPDKSGRRRPVPIEGSNYVIPCDVLIAAISQEPDLAGLEGENLKTNKWQCFETDPATLATSRPGVFAGGDVVTGPSTVVQAIGMGRDGAESIHRYLRGLDLHENRPKLKDRTKFIKDDRGDRHQPQGGDAQAAAGRAPRQLQGDRARLPGGDGAQGGLALPQLRRLLRVLPLRRRLPGQGDRARLAVRGAGRAAGRRGDPRPRRPALRRPRARRTRPRALAERGDLDPVRADPLRLRPLQGRRAAPLATAKHPVKVAWIQCVGSRDPHNANPWCSSVCCMYATKQAIIAKEHDARIEPKIFFMEMRAFGKDFDKYVERAKNEYGVKYQRAMVSAIREEPGTGNLVLRHALEDGKLVDETFDMVVLSVGFQPHQDAARFAEIFGIEANDYRFAKTSGFAPVETSRPGIFVTGTYQGPKDIPDTVMQGSAVAGGRDGAARRGARDRGRQEGAAAGDGRRGRGAADRRLRLPLRHEHLLDRQDRRRRRGDQGPARRRVRHEHHLRLRPGQPGVDEADHQGAEAQPRRRRLLHAADPRAALPGDDPRGGAEQVPLRPGGHPRAVLLVPQGAERGGDEEGDRHREDGGREVPPPGAAPPGDRRRDARLPDHRRRRRGHDRRALAGGPGVPGRTSSRRTRARRPRARPALHARGRGRPGVRRGADRRRQGAPAHQRPHRRRGRRDRGLRRQLRHDADHGREGRARRDRARDRRRSSTSRPSTSTARTSA